MYENIWTKLIDARSKYFKQEQKKKEKEYKDIKEALDKQDDLLKQDGPHVMVLQSQSQIEQVKVEIRHSNGKSAQDISFNSLSTIIDLKEYILAQFGTPIEAQDIRTFDKDTHVALGSFGENMKTFGDCGWTQAQMNVSYIYCDVLQQQQTGLDPKFVKDMEAVLGKEENEEQMINEEKDIS